MLNNDESMDLILKELSNVKQTIIKYKKYLFILSLILLLFFKSNLEKD